MEFKVRLGVVILVTSARIDLDEENLVESIVNGTYD